MRVSALKSKVDEKDSYVSAQCEYCEKAKLAVHEVEIEKRMLSRVLASFERKKDHFFYKIF